MSIRKKLFLISFLAFLVLGGTELFLISKIYTYNNTIKSIKDQSIETALLSQELKLDVVEVQQWLTEISATGGGQGYDQGFDKAREVSERFEERMETLQSIETDKENKQLLENSSSLFQRFYNYGRQMAQGYISGGQNTGNLYMAGFDDLRNDINGELDAYLEGRKSELRTEMSNIEESMEQLTILSLIILAGGLIVVGVVSNRISSGITKSLRVVGEGAQQIANGDLTQPMEVKRKDEIGMLANEFEQMRVQLSSLVTAIQRDANEIQDNSLNLSDLTAQTGESASQIAVTIDEVAHGVEDQSVQAGHILDAIQDTTQKVSFGNELADRTLKGAASSTTAAQGGQASIEEGIQGLQSTVRDFNEATETVQSLGERSNQIGDIIKFIHDISEQTNLLSLNAAIEAARAGQHGLGFSVVAEEVRKLAEETKKATGRISSLIKETQRETHRSIQLMESNQSRFTEQVRVIQDGGQSLRQIVEHVQSTEHDVGQLKEILKSIDDNTVNVQRMIESITAVIEETSASSEEVAASAQQQDAMVHQVRETIDSLSSIAQELNGQVAQFKR
ncbi:hypothetical protein N781_16640 [Pontibacillus halophilus JSM 076056 = DSM 19796]|uniref:Methyl-accepting chemotaxis protein n=1 Tax=Pontibacillus halophilus JSM 076056 = DSM 19796 TaxID=1385510 RepID=A0A0A5I9L5_9BACI|nr:methyl-accepting chemotaxis protein [Pontibacillus halophilus]KGX92497.1 hypothetical protein N781_16640 [Pontibacillus halophilus JSM 076056 = DSM 19796]